MTRGSYPISRTNVGGETETEMSSIAVVGTYSAQNQQELNNNTVEQPGKHVKADDEGEIAVDCWCLSGCLTTLTVAALVPIGLPVGVLLLVFATNNGDQTLLAVGICILLLPVIGLPIIVVIVINRRRLKKRLQALRRGKPDT